MSVLHHLPCNPATNTMHEHVQRIFASSGMRGLVELSWTSTRTPHKLEHGRLYDLADLDDLVEHAASLNASANCNVYISAGLRRSETPTTKRAGDSDVFATVAVWADFDKPAGLTAAIDVAERLNLRPNVVVFTGNEPHLRGQMWWVLEEPCEDLALHRRLQSALAQRLGGDPSVVNPSRVMRLGGSVAWPLKAGRVLEMTGFYDVETRTAPYTIDEIEAKLRHAGALEQVAPTAKVLDFSAAAPVLDLDDMVERAREAGQWHKNALLATAHLLGRGTPPDVVLDVLTGRLQQPGFTYHDTRRELEVMVRGGVRRGMGANALREQLEASLAVTPAVEGEAAKKRSRVELVAFKDLQSMEPPEWSIEGMIPEKSFGYIFGRSNTFKTFVTLDMALSIAFGILWQGRPTKKGKVIYILGEGQGGFADRVRAWQLVRGLLGQDCEFWTIFRSIGFTDKSDVTELVDAVSAAGADPDWVFVDTVQRNFGAGDPDKTQDMTIFVNAVDAVREHFDCGIFAVHHAGKDMSQGARNSSVLYASADFEMRTDREEGAQSVTLSCTKAKNWEEFDRIHLGMESCEVLNTSSGELTKQLAVSGESAPSESDEPRAPNGKTELSIMSVLVDGGSLSVGEIAARTGQNKGSVSRALASLRAKRCVAKDADSGLHFIPVNNQ